MTNNENRLALAGSEPIRNTVHASATNSSDYTKPSLKEQAILDRVEFLARDLEAEQWSTSGLRKLAETLRSLQSKADAERYRRLSPAETGTGLLGLLSCAKGGE